MPSRVFLVELEPVSRLGCRCRCRSSALRSRWHRSARRAGYCLPSKPGPFSVISVMPLPLVSTRWTFGRLKVGRYSLSKARPLAHQHVPRLQRLGGGLVLDDLLDARDGCASWRSMFGFSWRRIFSSRGTRPRRASAPRSAAAPCLRCSRRRGLPAGLQRWPPSRDRSASRRGCRSPMACAGTHRVPSPPRRPAE